MILLLLSLLTIASTKLTKQPNIIYILSDDLGHADVGFTNGPVSTPVLNKLAREGVLLHQHYVQQVCSPTRGALMSGRYPIHTGLQHGVIYPGEPWGLPLDETLIPKVLKQYNYSTHARGKWHLGMHTWDYTPVYRGFDDFFGYYLGAQDYLTHYRGDGLDLRSDYWDADGNMVDELRHDLDDRYSTELYSESVIELFDKVKSQENPFFLYMAFQNVHAPHMVPQKYIDKYSTGFINKKERVFAAMVGAMDEAIGNITQALERTGLADNTLIIFSSDNGGNVNCCGQVTSSNYPYRGGKRAMYEGGIRSPSFIWGPGLMPGTVSTAMIHVTDWLPTLQHVASLEGALAPAEPIVTKALDGVNQWSAISQLAPSAREEFIINIDKKAVGCGHRIPMLAIRYQDYKLIIGEEGCAGGPPCGWYPAPGLHHYDQYNMQHGVNNVLPGFIKPNSSFELYNIILDPSETHNLYNRPKYQGLFRVMLAKIQQYDKGAVPPGNKNKDPRSNPSNFNNTWMPWLKQGEEVEQRGEYGITRDEWLEGNGLSKEELLNDDLFLFGEGFDDN